MEPITLDSILKDYIKQVPENRVSALYIESVMMRVAQRAIELGDNELNGLMCELGMYSIADPTHPDYNRQVKADAIIKGRGRRRDRIGQRDFNQEIQMFNLINPKDDGSI